MDKIKKYLMDFIATRNITFYISFGFVVLAAITGIVSGATLSFAGDTLLTVLLPLLGLLAFVGLSLVGQEKAGAAAAGLLIFGAFIALICGVYLHFLNEIQNQAMGGFNIGAIEGLFALIVCVALLAICAIAANVFAWLRLKKKPTPDTSEKEEKENAV